MNIIVVLIMLLTLCYSCILFLLLWRKSEKAGAFSVLFLTLITLTIPFFSMLK